MIDIPTSVQIKSTIQPGSVFLFTEETFTSSKPHFFIVINRFPINEDIILLVASSSKIKKTKRRRRKCPGTLVIIEKGVYGPFSEDSIVDCNVVIEKNIEKLISKLNGSELQPKKEMSLEIVEELREAVC